MQAEYCICGKGMIISGDMFEYGNIAGCGIEDIDTSPVCSHPYFLFEFGHAQYDVTAQTGVLSGIAGYQFSLGGETLDAIVVGWQPYSLLGVYDDSYVVVPVLERKWGYLEILEVHLQYSLLPA